MQILWRTVSQKKNCRTFIKTYSIYKRKNHARGGADTTKKVKVVKDTQEDRRGAEIFMLSTPTKTREKVKIDGKYFHMQVDTGFDITLIPVNLWPDL